MSLARSAVDRCLQAAAEIPVRNVWYLLLYAWDKAKWKDRTFSGSEHAPKLHGLLARILVNTTRELFQRQLGRSYTRRRDEIRGVRGRIDFSATLKSMSLRKGALQCWFSELHVDTLKNRILLATLNRLAISPNLTLAYQPEQEKSLRHDLRSLVRMLEDVSLVPINSSDFARLQIGRNDDAYALPLAICELVYKLEIPVETAGDHATASILRNEIKFHNLFERFVRNFYRLHLTTFSVGRETLSWHDELACKYVPLMHTDITLSERCTPHRRVIIDTKYSTTTLVEKNEGTEKFKSENLYQLYAYLRTQEHLSPAHLRAEGMLLYPTTRRDLEESMKVQGHKIRVATLDLAQPWEQIEARLLKLVPQYASHG